MTKGGFATTKEAEDAQAAIMSDTYTHLLAGIGREAAERAWSLVPRATTGRDQDREQSVRNPVRADVPKDSLRGRTPVRGLEMEPPWGVEPQTYALRVRRSNRLS